MEGLVEAANVSMGRLELTTEYFLVPTPSAPPPAPPFYAPPPPPPPGILRRDTWVAPLLVFSSLTMILIALFEVFVLLKTWRTTPYRRQLFLDQMLLLGLFLCAAVSALLSAEPTVLTCTN